MMTKNIQKILIALLLLVAGGSEAWGQAKSDYSGVYYIASSGYNSTSTETNYYLCPTESWYYYQSTSPYYTNTGNEMPFMTTYQCRNGEYDAGKAVWIIERKGTTDDYYIKRAIDGKYLTYNGKMDNCNKEGRMRVHLEESPTDEDATLWSFAWISSKSCYDIISKKTDSYKYLNVNDGNKPYLNANGKPDGPESMNTGGIIENIT